MKKLMPPEEKMKTQKRELNKNFQGEEGGIRPLRTFQSDLAEAMKGQAPTPSATDTTKKPSKKIFPWLS